MLNYAAGIEHGWCNGRNIIGHDGAWSGFRSALLLVPELKAGVVVLANSSEIPAEELAYERLALLR